MDASNHNRMSARHQGATEQLAVEISTLSLSDQVYAGFHIRLKNTFLEVMPLPMDSLEELRLYRRPTSDPGCSPRSSSISHSILSIGSEIGLGDNHQSYAACVNIVTEWTGESRNVDTPLSKGSSSPRQEPSSAVSKTKQRPCKARRMRYRNLVSRLGTNINADPEAFDSSKIEIENDIPVSIASNDVLMSKLRRSLEKIKQQKLVEQQMLPLSIPRLGGASADAGKCGATNQSFLLL